MSELTRESSYALRTVIAVAVSSLWGCAPEVPIGRFGCDSDSDCPSGWLCAENGTGDRRCYPEGTDFSAIRGDHGSSKRDADVDAAERADSGSSDTDASSGSVGNPPPASMNPPAAGSGGSAAGAPASGSGGGSAGAPAAGSGGSAPDAGPEPPPAGCETDVADPNAGVFVSPNDGNSNSDCGSEDDPCSTISLGMQRAHAQGRSALYLDTGSYTEPVTIMPGLTLRGGYERSDNSGPGKGGWKRSCDPARASFARIESSTIVGVWAEYDGEATLETLTVSTLAQAPQGDSTYGVFARGQKTRLTLRDVDVYAASGGNGTNGMAGATPATRTGTCTPAGDGVNATATGRAGTGASAGMFDSTGYVPANGEPGGSGVVGNNGTAGLSSCVNCFESCDATACGVNTTGQSCGFGGAPGCGGLAAAGGGGGGGGGSSFGVFAWGAHIEIIGGLLQSGNGGRGAAGGNPGTGGLGSTGADGLNGETCTVCKKGATGPITPPPPSPDEGATNASSAEIAVAKMAPADRAAVAGTGAIPIDGGVIAPIGCYAAKGSGIGTAGGRGGSGSAGGVGGGGAGGHSYGAYAGGQGMVEVSADTKIEIGQAGRSQGNGANGEAATVLIAP